MQYKPIRAIISGGGTGGHIFPAVSIGHALKECNGQSEILFVGALGKMEMEKVPAEGFRIVGLPIAGMQRKLSLKNLLLPFKVLKSVAEARRVLKEFKPDVVVGVGGYASAPLLWAATAMKIPCLIQEQNGFAGLTNRTLAKKVQSICVAYEGMERFFPAERIVMSGNPIRKALSSPATPQMKADAIEHFGLDASKKHLFVVGGSLGCGTLNRCIQHWIQDGCPGGEDVEVIWQCGKYYKAGVDEFMAQAGDHPLIHHYDFIGRMDLAFAAADVVISRSGASTVSEICAMGKAAVFVPSPNVAEDHQTHNAMALVRRDAATLVRDADAPTELMSCAIDLLNAPERRAVMEKNALGMALTNASQIIVDEIYKLV
ncbi:MAG: undecaprenyldiphospho-muramoylpentapeptide beta-N-acetylglucosaminyltransferase [Bacteroidales bacterium]|nr:undecaprenyldiphospho-muramoylpentapeptide beta-N-acetylglucosaminyltransferase [Bacteroidales bacterium]MBP5373871.1 undecaprenyldiphospho-muramoylpentapeptide beta-N-acetylglucosaminyltransferase [Bacteroidales bacterium]